MIFHGYFRSSAAWRCRIAFGLKAAEPEFRPVHLRRKDHRDAGYLALNPAGLVPALDTGAGVLRQSLAIIEWLEETIPTPALLPADPMERAKVRAFALDICCDIHPLQNLRVLESLSRRFGIDQAGKDDWCGEWIRAGLSACETIAREQRHQGAFTFGAIPGLAEICLVPQMASARRFNVDIADLTRLNEITAACAEQPAFLRADPSAQPDFE